MKKLIFSFGLLLLTLSGYPQSSTFGTSSPTTDTSSNPSGTGFGGAMGGATTSGNFGNTTTPNYNNSTAPATAPTGSSSLPNSVSPGYGSPQQMQDVTSPSNVPSTTAPAPASNLPSGTGTTTQPTNVPRTTVPSATGVGTGSPSGF